MLETLRHFLKTWVAKVLLGFVMLSFGVFFGISDITRNIGVKSYVAKVGSREITVKEFQKEIYRQTEAISIMMKKRVSLEELRAAGLEKQILSQMIGRRLIELELEKMNVSIPDDRAREEIYKQKQFRDQNGLFDHAAFERFLRIRGYTEKEFMDLYKHDMATKVLLSAIANGVRVSPTFVDIIYDYMERPREVRVVKIPFDTLPFSNSQDKPLEEFYIAHKDDFKRPEYRKIEYHVLSKEKLDKSREIEDKLASGKSFKEVAAELSLKIQTMDYIDANGTFQDKKKTDKLSQDPSFLETVFSTNENMDSMLFELQSGDWCVLHVSSLLPAHVPAFETIKPEVIKAAKFDEQKKNSQKLGSEIVDALKSQKGDLDMFAKKYKQTVSVYKNIVRNIQDEKKSVFPMNVLDKIMTIKYEGFAAIPGDDHLLIVSVPHPMPRDEEKKKKDYEAFSDRVDGLIGNDIVKAYIANLEKAYGVEIVK